MAKLLLVYLELLVELFAKRLDIVERFGVSLCELYATTGSEEHRSSLCGFEDVVKLLLQCRRLRQGPIRLFLVTKDNILQDRPRHAQKQGDLFVHLGTLCRDGVPLPVSLIIVHVTVYKACVRIHLSFIPINVRLGQHPFQRLHSQPSTLFHSHLQRSCRRHSLSIDVPET